MVAWRTVKRSVDVPIGKSHGAADAGGGAVERVIIDHGAAAIGRGRGDDPVANLRRAFDQIGRRHLCHVSKIVLLQRANKPGIEILIDLGVAQAAGTDDDDPLWPGNLPEYAR